MTHSNGSRNTSKHAHAALHRMRHLDKGRNLFTYFRVFDNLSLDVSSCDWFIGLAFEHFVLHDVFVLFDKLGKYVLLGDDLVIHELHEFVRAASFAKT